MCEPSQQVEAVEDIGEALACGGESGSDGVGCELEQACARAQTRAHVVEAGFIYRLLARRPR